MESRLIFQDHRELFQKYALGTMTKSNEYAGIETQFEDILVLGNRALAACIQHPDIGRAWDIADDLDAIRQIITEGGDFSKQSEKLGEHTERWLKAIFWMLFPIRRMQITEPTFTLPVVSRELGLLTQ